MSVEKQPENSKTFNNVSFMVYVNNKDNIFKFNITEMISCNNHSEF